MSKKIFFSCLTGFIVLFLTWIYQNYDHSRPLEEKFFKTLYTKAFKLKKLKADINRNFLFINTGKDLALVEDTIDYGNITVSDREKIYKLIHHINSAGQPPLYTVLDIQFYYPYTINPTIDTLLESELNKNAKILIPILKDESGVYKKPLYKAHYAFSDYTTYGSNFNKFRIFNDDIYNSIPVTVHQIVDSATYKKHPIFSTVNNKLCLAAIWPSFYIRNNDVNEIKNIKQLNEIEKDDKRIVKTEYYNIGELVLMLDAESNTNIFQNKIVIIGNFESDVHNTAVGKMSGPVLLANIYLSLLHNQHVANFWFFFLLFIVFSALSYVALYKEIPKIQINFKFMFSADLHKLLNTYITYWGCLFLLSLIVVFLFNMHVALFFPTLLISVIEYFSKKRYAPIIDTYNYFRHGEYKTSFVYIYLQRFRKKFYLIKK